MHRSGLWTDGRQHYWSATTVAASPSTAWDLIFANGGVGGDNKDGNIYVRAVRTGS